MMSSSGSTIFLSHLLNVINTASGRPIATAAAVQMITSAIVSIADSQRPSMMTSIMPQAEPNVSSLRRPLTTKITAQKISSIAHSGGAQSMFLSPSTTESILREHQRVKSAQWATAQSRKRSKYCPIGSLIIWILQLYRCRKQGRPAARRW